VSNNKETVFHVGRPNIGNREAFLKRVEQILDSKWLSNNGPFVQEFEARIADYLGVKHAIVTCNGTVALQLAAKALELKGEVIVPSYTFIATAHALFWEGIRPVFADIDPKAHCLDPVSVESRITEKTSGIAGVHLWGHGCPVEALQDIADRHGLQLMFDASHAFGCSHGGKMIGNFGRCEVFSFHATKFLNSFEGGAITTNDDALAEKLRLMKNFGFRGYDNVEHLGTNGKMPEICAAMGITGMESIDEFIQINKTNYEAYKAGFEELEGISLFEYPSEERNNYQYIVAELDQDIAEKRDTIVEALHSTGVKARKYFWPGCHKMMPYSELYLDENRFLLESEIVADRVIVLPTGTQMYSNQINQVVKTLSEAIG